MATLHTPAGFAARFVLLCAYALGCGLLQAPFQRVRAQGPRDIPGIGYERGATDARIVIVEFVDYSCSACATFARATMPGLQREWIATGRARIRVIPFDAGLTGRAAARAALCAGEQDAFWRMHDLLFERQSKWRGRIMQARLLEDFAAELGLDAATFVACWKSGRALESLERNTRLARSYGVPGTPAFFVNGRPLVGALGYDEFVNYLRQAGAVTG